VGANSRACNGNGLQLPRTIYNYARSIRKMKPRPVQQQGDRDRGRVTLRVGGKVDKASLDGDLILGAFDAARLGCNTPAIRL